MKFARRHQTLFIEASAKTRDGVQCAFEELVHKVANAVNSLLFVCLFVVLLQIIQTPGLWESYGTDNVRIDNKDHPIPESRCAYACSLV